MKGNPSHMFDNEYWGAGDRKRNYPGATVGVKARGNRRHLKKVLDLERWRERPFKEKNK